MSCRPFPFPLRRAVQRAAVFALAGAALPALALQFPIANGAAQIYLRVGATGGTTSVVSFVLTGQEGILGTGTPIAGTVAASAGAFSAAQTPNFPACPANQVRIVARARSTAGAPRVATLQVSAPADLIHAASGNTIPFGEIGWVSSEPADIPSGTFSGGGVVVLRNNINTSQEIGTCNQFNFLNVGVYPGSVGGTGYYQGNATYNLVMP